MHSAGFRACDPLFFAVIYEEVGVLVQSPPICLRPIEQLLHILIQTTLFIAMKLPKIFHEVETGGCMTRGDQHFEVVTITLVLGLGLVDPQLGAHLRGSFDHIEHILGGTLKGML